MHYFAGVYSNNALYQILALSTSNLFIVFDFAVELALLEEVYLFNFHLLHSSVRWLPVSFLVD